jgi:hypothetical protein
MHALNRIKIFFLAETNFILFLLVLFCALFHSVPFAHAQKLTPEMLGKPREDIRFSDKQLRLFNGRGCAYVRQYSLTGIHAVQFPPIDLPQYRFRIDFRDKDSGLLIQDNIPDLYDEWKDKKSGYDPLGVNFRAGYPYAMLSQNEYWQPNLYRRNGTFHKQINGRWISFAIETETLVSGSNDEVYLEVKLSNRSDAPLRLTCLPKQSIRFNDTTDTRNDQIYRHTSPFIMQNSRYRISVISDLADETNEGWEWQIPAKSTEKRNFVIQLHCLQQPMREASANDLGVRIQTARETIRKRLSWAADKLPEIKTDYKNLDEFYRRCILTVTECQWERENFMVKPFWSSGSWIYIVPWDLSFLSDMLSMMSPESMRDMITLSFKEGQLDCTYMGWDECAPGIFYIMQPFALQTMINAYLRQTGDVPFLQQRYSGKTVLQWMKEWAGILETRYRSKAGGMIDIGQDTEALIEIRTDGFDYIVPVLNGLTVEFYNWLAYWCRDANDADSVKFAQSARDLEKAFHENSWNATTRWFDNLYPDGSRKSVYSNLTFDLLGTEVLTDEERLGLLSHLNDNEFLGPYSVFSMSRQGQVHWDRVDADWGGGGSYTGTVLQLVRNLYNMEMGQPAWTILKRFTQYVDHFPYISQNYRADEPFQDESSMPMEICAGSGVEAVIFGLFGFKPQIDGTLDIRPVYAYDLGQATLSDYKFREHRYDITMNRYGFTLTCDGTPYGSYRHGQTVRILPDGRYQTLEEMQIAAPTVQTDGYRFLKQTQVQLKSATPRASIRYTTDGSLPTMKSTLFTKPFIVSKSCQLKARAFLPDQSASVVATVFFEKIQAADLKSKPSILSEFIISQSFRGYVGPDGKDRYPMTNTSIKWQKAITDEKGVVWLSQQLVPFADCHAFAVTEITAHKETATNVLIGSNDGAFAWLNGELILNNYKERPLYYNQFVLPVKLKKGKNILALMVLQAGGSWGFNVNIEMNPQEFECRVPSDILLK